VPFLNGNNGEWTNGDDLDQADRKRRHKEATTQQHRTEPGKYKGKGKAERRGGPGRGGTADGRFNEAGNLIMGGGRGHGPGTAGGEQERWPRGRETGTSVNPGAAPRASADVPAAVVASEPSEGKHDKPVPVPAPKAAAPAKPAEKKSPRGPPTQRRQETEKPAKPQRQEGKPGKETRQEGKPGKETHEANSDEEPKTDRRIDYDFDNWVGAARCHASMAILEESHDLFVEYLKLGGKPDEIPEFGDSVGMQLKILALKRDRIALKEVEKMLKETAGRRADELFHVVNPFIDEVRCEAEGLLRKRQKERAVAEYLAEHDPPPPPAEPRYPAVAMRFIPLASEPEPCCYGFTEWFRGFWRSPFLYNIPEIEGDDMEPFGEFREDNETAWHIKLGYNRTYRGEIYPELADYLVKEYLPTSAYTEHVLSRMHYDSVKWFEEQGYADRPHLAVETNTINWVVVQNQVARARNSARLRLGQTASVRVPWR